MMKSMQLLVYKAEEGAISVRARDYNTNWVGFCKQWFGLLCPFHSERLACWLLGQHARFAACCCETQLPAPQTRDAAFWVEPSKCIKKSPERR